MTSHTSPYETRIYALGEDNTKVITSHAMARRPDRREVEILSEENLKEIRYNLAHLSLPAVRDAYDIKKCDSGEYRGAVIVLGCGIPGGRMSGEVDVLLIQHEDQKPDQTVFLFERRKPGPPRNPVLEAMIKAKRQEIWPRFNEGRE